MYTAGIGATGKSIATSARWSWANELHCAEQMQSGMKKQGSGNQMMGWNTVYNGGFPPVGVPLIITVYDRITQERALIYPVYYMKSLKEDKWSWYCAYTAWYNDFNSSFTEITSDDFDIVAWTEFPDTYKGGSPEGVFNAK